MSADSIASDLGYWEHERAEHAERHLGEVEELLTKRNELLVRAREAGWTNTEIAETLNSARDSSRYTQQSVTAMMRDADTEVAIAVDQLLRKRDHDDEDDEDDED